MKTLVTGGAGFIGSHLTDKLIELGHEVIVLDNLCLGKQENINPKAEFYNIDICDDISSLFKDVEYVFHLAAIPRVPLSVEDPVGTSRANIIGTINVFKAAADNKVKRVIFSSSSSVYGNQDTLPLIETMVPDPISPYAIQKFTGERFAKVFSDLYGLLIISLRYFNCYGPRVDFDSDYSLVIGKFLKQKAEGKTLTIFGDGEQTRGFSYVTDVVKANILASESNKVQAGEVINISSGDSQSINYIADLIGGEKQYLPVRKGDVLHTKADISKAKELLGWEPTISFEQGMEKVKVWFNKEYKRLEGWCMWCWHGRRRYAKAFSR